MIESALGVTPIFIEGYWSAVIPSLEYHTETPSVAVDGGIFKGVKVVWVLSSLP